MSRTITLSDSVAEKVQRLIADGDYPDSEAVLTEAIERLAIEHRHRRLMGSIRQADLAMDEGQIHRESDDLWDAIHVRASAKVGSGEPFDPDVVS